MVKKKILQFQTSIQDVKPPLYGLSHCSVRIMYTGVNRNMSLITKTAVENALPTLLGIPIVGEFSKDNKDWKGHGGQIDMDTYDFVHTTQPYGFVPADASYEWEMIGGREYLTIHNCILWTERYPEAYSIIENAKGQSMEIEVNSGKWNDDDEVYQIDDFRFSALCILGDDVTPAFEDASIYAYSFSAEGFKKDYMEMIAKYEMVKKQKEGEKMILKELLAKYSTSMEELTKLGFNLEEVSEETMEDKIVELLEVEKIEDNDGSQQENPEDKKPEDENPEGQQENPEDNKPEEQDNPEDNKQTEDFEAMKEVYEKQISDLKVELDNAKDELEKLKTFKLDVEKEKHADKVQAMFSNFQLTEDDVKDIDIHAFSVEQLENKCYEIIGRKMATRKDFSLDNNQSNRLPLNQNKENFDSESPYGEWVQQYIKE